MGKAVWGGLGGGGEPTKHVGNLDILVCEALRITPYDSTWLSFYALNF